jgi:hypothetical protein
VAGEEIEEKILRISQDATNMVYEKKKTFQTAFSQIEIVNKNTKF